MKGHQTRNVLVVLCSRLCQWLWGLWETHAATSLEDQRPVSPCGVIKGPQNAPGAQGQEELL